MATNRTPIDERSLNEQHHHESTSSVSSLIGNFAREVTTLVQKEAELAKAEFSAKLNQASNGAISLLMGALVLFAGVLVLLDAAVLALAEAVSFDQVWLSPLIIGAIVGVIGLIMLMKGRSNLRSRNLAPQETATSLREDKEFAKGQMQ